MYKKLIDPKNNTPIADGIKRLSDNAFIPFDPANTDYANFKREVLTDEAQLQDENGTLMTPQDAKDFVGSLP